MDTSSSEWEDNNEFKSYQVRVMSMQKYNNLLTSGSSSNKDPKDDQILYLVGVAQKL